MGWFQVATPPHPLRQSVLCQVGPKEPPQNAPWRRLVFGTILRKCRRCGHRVPWESTHRATWNGRRTWVCTPCHLEIVEKDTGYHQAELDLVNQPSSDQEAFPF